MKMQRPLIIIGIIILVLVGLFFLFWEQKEVSAYNWYTSYGLESKEPFGMYAFTNILKNKYGEKSVHVGERFLIDKLDTNKRNVVIVVSNNNRNYFDDSNDFINDLLYTVNDSKVKVVWMASPLSLPQNGVRLITDEKFKLDKETFTFEKNKSEFKYDYSTVIKDSIAIASYETLKLYIDEYEDSDEEDDSNDGEDGDVNAQVEDEISEVTVDTAVVINEGEVDTLNDYIEDAAEIESDDKEEDAVKVSDTINEIILHKLISTPKGPVFGKVNFEEDAMPFYAHSAPILFTNFAAKQPFYASHLNYVLDELDGEEFYLLNNINFTDKAVNPLKYIFEQKALKTAYYLLLVLLALYLIFGSKRLFRPIPVLEEKRNTSLEYISTVARLYEYKDDNYTMVKKMQEIFYSKMYKQFYIPSHEPEYNKVLAKKAKLDVNVLNSVKHYFDSTMKYNHCTDEDLYMLNEYLNVIYSKIKSS